MMPQPPAPYYSDDAVTLYHGDSLAVLRSLPDRSVDSCVTSPPYFGLRDYGEEGQYGLESSPAEYVETMRALFAEVRRVLTDDGTLWLNIGDTYYSGKGAAVGPDKKQPARRGYVRPVDKSGAGWAKPKDLLGIPWRTAFALQDDGWYLRNDIIWAKPNGMPESVTDRLSTKHEHLFLLTKSRNYWFDLDPIREEVKYPAGSPQLNWARASKEADVPGQSTRQHRDNRTPGKGGGTNLQATGRQHLTPERAQKRRANELFQAAGLTDEHVAAMRAVGMSDAGKARETQSGTGKNAPHVQRLADEAKAALGGYYREFLYDGGRNPGDVWTVPTIPFSEAHFAVMPPDLARRAILAGCKPGGTVLDPFSGSGTTGMVAGQTGRRYVGIDLNRDYLDLSLRTRLAQTAMIDVGGVA
jgi:site-specific DNA-methyltransferase (cytosine-N4-specific)